MRNPYSSDPCYPDRYVSQIFFILFFLLLLTTGCRQDDWTDSSLDPGRRADALLKEMTLEEKVGQLLCPLGWPVYEKVSPDSVILTDWGRSFLREQGGGSLWATFRADPWTKKTLETGLDPRLAARTANAIQRLVLDSTRLGIPVFLAEEMPHGHMAIGTTTFPTGIGLASTWDPVLLEAVGDCIGSEVRRQGSVVGYGPVIDLAREPRWSRVEEGYGEDPFLSGTLASAFVRGAASTGVISTVKHFVAYGIPSGGHNGNSVSIGDREMREQFLPPFKRIVEAGALSLMTSYNSLDGVPSTGHEALLTGLLRDQWGFEGYVVSDLSSIDGLAGTHHVVANKQEAAELALRAGVDVDLGAACYPLLIKSVREGRIPESLVDRAVRRVLVRKFASGLFEQPFVDEAVAESQIHDDDAVALALQTARESITLLDNNGVLPLRPGARIALIGPNADNVYNQLGDYTAPQADRKVVTMLDGLRACGAKVIYAKGCAIRDTKENGIDEAVRAARASDVVVAVVGGSSARDFRTSYEETGAAVTDASVISDMESGEGFDRSSLDLLGLQPELLKALKATGKPLVVVYIEGRPLDKRWAKDNADALLTLWYPGEQGGTALADVLFGDYNPAGRLPISVPRDVGQLPVYYNQRIPFGHDYVEEPVAPLYPFGHGLSYTTFTYGDLRVTTATGTPSVMPGSDRPSVMPGSDRASESPDGQRAGQKTVDGDSDGGILFATIDITNTGDRDGEEVVQIYLIDEVASTVRPRKQLCGFARVAIPAGETRTVTISLDRRCFELVNTAGETLIEPGTFRLQAGASSRDIRSETTITL